MVLARAYDVFSSWALLQLALIYMYVLCIQLSAIEKSTQIAEEEKKELMAHINVSKNFGTPCNECEW